MRIVHVTDALSAYIDGELAGDERAQVERHLETCEDCRRQLTELKQVVMLVRSSEPIAAPEGFHAHVRARVEQEGSIRHAARWWPGVPLAWRVIGAAAAVAIIGIFAASVLRTEGPIAMREGARQANEAPAVGMDRMQSEADRSGASSPVDPKRAADPKMAQRTITVKRSHPVQRVVLIGLPPLALGALAWMVVRRRRQRRVREV